jgi:hypothetical protein
LPVTSGENAVDDQFFEVHEPYSGELFARVAAGSDRGASMISATSFGSTRTAVSVNILSDRRAAYLRDKGSRD